MERNRSSFWDYCDNDVIDRSSLKSWIMCQCFLCDVGNTSITFAIRTEAQLMYSWCITCNWCPARQSLLYCTYLRSLVYACTNIYGISKILPSLKKMPCHTDDIIVRNVTIQGIFSLDLVSFWCYISSIPYVTITKKVFLVYTNSNPDTSWGIHELRHSELNDQELWGWVCLQPCRQFIIDLGLLR